MFISRKRIHLCFPLPLKRSKKNLSIYLTLKTDSTYSIFWWNLRRCKSERKKEKKRNNWKQKFSIYFTLENELVNLRVKSPWMQKQKKKKNLKVKKNFQSWKNLNIVFISRRCIYFEALYWFWGIVFISRHCIYFETLYLFRDIVFISRYCIYFEILYLFQDIVFISRHCINFTTMY